MFVEAYTRASFTDAEASKSDKAKTELKPNHLLY